MFSKNLTKILNYASMSGQRKLIIHKNIINMIKDFIVRKKIKNGGWLNGEQELRLFEMPDCVELLPQYIKNWGLIHEEILLELEDERLFEQYCVTNRHLDQKIVDKIFTDAGAVYYAWQPICAKYLALSPKNEVILVTSWPDATAEYIDKRQLAVDAELAMFSGSSSMSNKKKYIEEKRYCLYDSTVLVLLGSQDPFDEELLYSYMKIHSLKGGGQQIMLVKKHNLNLFSLFFENATRPLCWGAQALLLEWGDQKAIETFIQQQNFWADAEVAFVKDADADLVEKYIAKYQLSELAEIVLIERNNAKLIKTYLRNNHFSDHAWQYYVSCMN